MWTLLILISVYIELSRCWAMHILNSECLGLLIFAYFELCRYYTLQIISSADIELCRFLNILSSSSHICHICNLSHLSQQSPGISGISCILVISVIFFTLSRGPAYFVPMPLLNFSSIYWDKHFNLIRITNADLRRFQAVSALFEKLR